MKIACLIAVSKYVHGSDLPACENDLRLMRSLLEATGEYQEILPILADRESSKVKQQLTGFFKQFKETSIDQVLFYYTGHGDFDGREFRYLLSDYEPSRQKQTAIENSELDGWLRMLNPILAVKMVDACHAGVQYIKEPDALGQFLQSVPKALQTCYFLYSSLKEQASFQDATLSDFTKTIAQSIAQFEGTEMRFKDMIDYVSDAFASSGNQTPFFVTQATNTEVFTRVTGRLQDIVRQEISRHPIARFVGNADAIPDAVKPTSLTETVRADAQRYCTKDEVVQRLAEVEDFWKTPRYEGDIAELYDFQVTGIETLEGELPDIDKVGKWLSENKHEYFAEPTFRSQAYTEEVSVPVTGIRAMMNPHDTEIKTVTRHRSVVGGYRLTEGCDIPAIRITAKPEYPNLKWHSCHVAYVFSRTEVRLFYLFDTLRELNWEERTRVPTGNWQTISCPLREANRLDNALTKMAADFERYIMDPIRSQYAPEAEPPDAEKGSSSEASEE